MVWQSAADFWAMGGYGLYVWGSFGATALGVALEVWLLGRGQRAGIKQLQRMQRWEAE
ncbi:MAG: heme exporter protein CcmD [Betaproteobacteria bacterium]|nr:MAG: heme exporter protein CcmD [Betaproteobacteria bacterium]